MMKGMMSIYIVLGVFVGIHYFVQYSLDFLGKDIDHDDWMPGLWFFVFLPFSGPAVSLASLIHAIVRRYGR